MKPERYEAMQQAFLAVCDCDARERAQQLDQCCGADADLRSAVERLLAADDALSGILDTANAPAGSSALPAAATGHAAEQADGTSVPQPERIGHYAIRGVLGEGGMGIVYRAEQEHPRREVALKVIRPGVSSPRLLRRLEHEAELLGRLHHPGIAQIFEAGSADMGHGPQPFFAMELAEGRTITDYARAHALNTRARLALMVKFCDAVEHAHRHGVIHRDLKPGNVLVDDSGQPKILDFGVARTIDSDLQTTTLQTDLGQLIGTIPYMSPEQVSGDPAQLDTRSDVYSLGVLCYELLADRLPHDLAGKTIPDAVRIIGHDDPVPLSSVNRVFRGDLNTIVAKALDRDKERRYQSAAAFAADIDRYCRDEPIAARPTSAAYHLRKFAQRHTGLAAGVLIAVICLLSGTTASTVLWLRASAAAERANRQKANAEFMNDFLRDAFRSAWPEMSARNMTVRELLDNAAQQLKVAPPGSPLVLADLHVFVGEAYQMLELSELAQPHFRAAVELRAAQLGPVHARTLDAQRLLGRALAHSGDVPRGTALLYETLVRCREQLGPHHLVTADAMLDVAESPPAAPKDMRPDTLELALAALAIYEQQLGLDHPKTLRARASVANHYHFIARQEAAEALWRQGVAQLRTLGNADPRRRAALADTLVGLGVNLLNQARVDEAEKCFDEALAIDLEVHGADHALTFGHRSARARIFRMRGQWAELEQELRAIHAGHRRFFRTPHRVTLDSAEGLAIVLLGFGRREEAQALFVEAYDIARALHGPNSADPQVLHLLIETKVLCTPEERCAAVAAEIRRLVAVGIATGPELLRAFLEHYRQKRMDLDAVALVRLAIEEPGNLTGVAPADALLAGAEMAEFIDQQGRRPVAQALAASLLQILPEHILAADPGVQRLRALQSIPPEPDARVEQTR
ncbi:MAG: serine/threonine-protein kinase [Planctomycetota bacterium]